MPTMRTRQVVAIAVTATVAGLLTACGGGTNSEPEAAPSPKTLSSGEEVVLLPADQVPAGADGGFLILEAPNPEATGQARVATTVVRNGENGCFALTFADENGNEVQRGSCEGDETFANWEQAYADVLELFNEGNPAYAAD